MTISKNVWKLAAALLVLCLVSASMISGTYAKYSSTYAGEDSALVAKWEIAGSGDGFAVSGGALTLDLFSHAYKNNITASAGSIYIIAPGVGDEFTITLDNNSDVAAAIDFDIAATAGSASVPMVYTLDGIEYSNVTLLSDALQTAFGTIGADAAPVSKTVSWEWPIDGNDVLDTTLGKASADATTERTKYGLVVTASAVQVAPTK